MKINAHIRHCKLRLHICTGIFIQNSPNGARFLDSEALNQPRVSRHQWGTNRKGATGRDSWIWNAPRAIESRPVGADARLRRQTRTEQMVRECRQTGRPSSRPSPRGAGKLLPGRVIRHSVFLPLLTMAASVLARADDAAGMKEIPIAELSRDKPVDFAAEIMPIFKANCVACHAASDAEADLVLETPQSIVKGGASGPAVVPGESGKSRLLLMAAHRRKPAMPPADNKVGAKQLTSDQLGLIRLWIDQGAKGTAPTRAATVRSMANHHHGQPATDSRRRHRRRDAVRSPPAGPTNFSSTTFGQRNSWRSLSIPSWRTPVLRRQVGPTSISCVSLAFKTIPAILLASRILPDDQTLAASAV